MLARLVGDDGMGRADVVSKVAQDDPIRIRALDDYTYSEIAEAYRSAQARTYGVGWQYQKRPGEI